MFDDEREYLAVPGRDAGQIEIGPRKIDALVAPQTAAGRLRCRDPHAHLGAVTHLHYAADLAVVEYDGIADGDLVEDLDRAARDSRVRPQ